MSGVHNMLPQEDCKLRFKVRAKKNLDRLNGSALVTSAYLEKRAKQQRLLTVPEIAGRLIKFAEVMAEKKFYEYQTDFAWSIFEHVLLNSGMDLTALFSRQTGKSESAADSAVAMAVGLPVLANLYPHDHRLNRVDEQGTYRGFKRGFDIGIYAPTQEQSQKTLEKVKKALSSTNAVRILAELGVNWVVSNGKEVVLEKHNADGSVLWRSRVKSATASPKAKVEGDTHQLLILEEAQDLDDFVVIKSLLPMLASTNGPTVFVGTAGTKKCEFLSAIRRNIQKQLENPGVKYHFLYDADTCSRYNSLYAKFAAKMRDIYGEDSDTYQMAFKCRWLLDRGMFVTDEQLMDPSVARRVGTFSEIIPGHKAHQVIPPHYSIVAGLDFAMLHDSTVVTVMAVDWEHPLINQWVTDPDTGDTVLVQAFEKHIINWLELTGLDFENQFLEIREFLLKYVNLKKICADATGIGLPMFDRLRVEFEGAKVSVVPITVSAKMNSDMFKQLSADILRKRFSFPFGEEALRNRHVKKFKWQMLEAEKEIDNNGNLKVAAPKERDAYDDFVDSAAIAAFAAQEPVGGFSAETVHGVNFFSRRAKHRVRRGLMRYAA